MISSSTQALKARVNYEIQLKSLSLFIFIQLALLNLGVFKPIYMYSRCFHILKVLVVLMLH